MSARGALVRAAGGVGAATVAALATGVVVERRVARRRRGAGPGLEAFHGLGSDPVTVMADDGLRLHAEVDEVAPYQGRKRTKAPPLTLVFVHGYALNLRCWYCQRERLRGKYRMVFFDQRSHGRSERSSRQHATIDALGEDLRAVLDELVPEGRTILVGHSMGGMSIMALAEHHPELFGDKVAGVALLATSAGDLHPHRILSRLIPNSVGGFVTPRLIAALALAPELVDSARRRGSNVGFLVADVFAFGGDASPDEIEFLDEMLAGTPFSVIAEFFPGFTALDKYTVLRALDEVPALVIGAGKDRVTAISHSRRIAEAMPRAKYVECPDAGHMVAFEEADLVTEEIEALAERALAEDGDR